MRGLPSAIEQRLLKRIQAGDSAVRADLWISRPTVPLTEERFLEKQVLSRYSATDVSIAVDHTVPESDASNIYIAFIENGVAKVVRAAYNLKMSAHVWFETGFSEPAEYVAICFDGTMPKTTGDKIEFITDESPWVFWVLGGKLYARKLDGSETFTLAESRCSSVSAIRTAGDSLKGGFDYGLCLFFLLNGAIYVRQLIDGEWMDAEPINFGPNVTWVDIAACRSWDYRVVLQALAEDGSVYELFTQYMGVGQRAVEHIEVKNVDADARLTELVKMSTETTEHIEASASAEGALIYGLSSMPVSAANAENEDGDWGYVITILMDYPVADVENNAVAFTVSDEAGFSFAVVGASVSNSGQIITLITNNFNGATGALTVSYAPGTIQSPAVPMGAWSVKFDPQNLIAPEGNPPEPIKVFCGNDDGTVVHIRFSDQIIAGASESKDNFVVTIPVLTGTNKVFGEAKQTRNVSAVSGFIGCNIDVAIESGEFNDTEFGTKGLTLAKEGEST